MFKDLDIKQRAAVIKLGVGGGLRSLKDIAAMYDSIQGDPPLINRVNGSRANFVLRLKYPNRAYIRDWGNRNDIATHKMSWAEDDNGAIVYPNVLEIDGKLVDFSRPPYSRWAGYDSAVLRGDTVRMTPLEAEWFTTHYKNYYPGFDEYKRGGSIHIKPENRGKFTALKKRTGHSASWFKAHGTPALKKMATFALNARKWHHKDEGGPLDLIPGLRYINNGRLPYIKGSVASLNPELWVPSVNKDTGLINSIPKTFSYSDDGSITHYPAKRIRNKNTNKQSLEEIALFFWDMENPEHVGLNAQGRYEKFKDPNGKNWDVGPGLVIGSAIEKKPSYSKGELDTAAYNYYNKSMEALRPIYEAKYGQGEFDYVDDDSKKIISDVMYRVGKDGVTPSTWPNLFDAIYNQDTLNMLLLSRTTFRDENNVINYDNARVKRLGEYLYPGKYEYKYINSLDPGLKVKKNKKQAGSSIKSFSYLPIPEVRY